MALENGKLILVQGAEVLSNSSKDLEKIYNLLIQAENSKLTIVGHT
jgi:hypothetical protein